MTLPNFWPILGQLFLVSQRKIITTMHSIPTFRRLSTRLLAVMLAVTFAVGLLLSLIQVAWEYRYAKTNIRTSAAESMAMLHDPAMQAASELDRSLAEQVVSGLFQRPGTLYVRLTGENNQLLASKSRDPEKVAWRNISDLLFDKTQTFRASLPLNQTMPSNNATGEFVLTVDPAIEGAAFVDRAIGIFVSGLLRALLLGAIVWGLYHFMLTRPLTNLIRTLGSINPNQPGKIKLIIPAGHENDELGIWASKANELLSSIERNHEIRKAAEQYAEHLSNYDLLTALPNRFLFLHRLNESIEQASNCQGMLAVFCFALDDFKSINQTYSYGTGDQILMSLSNRLKHDLPFIATLARTGGDEFAIITHPLAQHYEAATCAQALLAKINTPIQAQTHILHIKATIGIAVYPHDGLDGEQLLKSAESVMQLAKTQGGNRYQFYVASVDTKIRARKSLEKDLSMAVENHELQLLYQPQIDITTRAIVGMEALVRWHHPRRGCISPIEFIPLAELNGSILEIGEWVMKVATADAAYLRHLGFADLSVSVNLSASQLRQSNLLEIVRHSLSSSGLAADALELEVTETAVLEDIDTAADSLKAIRDLGVHLAIDDFGTGYSSLNYLRKLPFNRIKIDRSFVRDITYDDDDASIVRTIIQLSHNLNRIVIAEGIENHDQMQYLQLHGCDIGQGFLFSTPLTFDQLIHFLKTQSLADLTDNFAV